MKHDYRVAGLQYQDERYAKQCEQLCSTQGACNPGMAKRPIELQKEEP